MKQLLSNGQVKISINASDTLDFFHLVNKNWFNQSLWFDDHLLKPDT